MPLPLSMQWAGDVHISDAAPRMHHRGLMRGGELCSLRSLALVRMLFRNFHFCSLLLVEPGLGRARVGPGSRPCPSAPPAAAAPGVAGGSGQPGPRFVRSCPLVPSLPLLPAAWGHKKKRVGFGP